jgi:hypothetical protein
MFNQYIEISAYLFICLWTCVNLFRHFCYDFGNIQKPLTRQMGMVAKVLEISNQWNKSLLNLEWFFVIGISLIFFFQPINVFSSFWSFSFPFHIMLGNFPLAIILVLSSFFLFNVCFHNQAFEKLYPLNIWRWL